MDNAFLFGFSLQMTYIKTLLLVQHKLQRVLFLPAPCLALGAAGFAQCLVSIIVSVNEEFSYTIAATAIAVAPFSSPFLFTLL